MTKFDEATLRELTWDNLKAVARENGVRVAQKREKITEELLQIPRPKMTQLAKLRGDKGTLKMEKIRRRTVGHVKTPPRPASSRGAAGARKTRASAARRASEPQPALAPEPAPESAAQPPQPEPVGVPSSAPAPAPTPVEAAKPEEELRPLERARALCRVEKERRAKEEAARAAEAQPPSATAPGESDKGAVDEKENTNTLVKSAPGKPEEEDDTHHREPMVFPRKRVLYPVGVPMPPPSPPKPRARTSGPRIEDWPDEWRVGLLSPDPSNPRPVFSPPVKKPCDGPAKAKEEAAQPRDKLAKEKESAQPPVPASEEKEAECAPVTGEQERVDDGGDTDTELAEEDEVFEMTSMDNIRVTLPEDEAQDHVDGADKFVREKKRKAEDDEEEEEKTTTTLERSPLKRRRTGLRGWLSKVF